MYFHTREKQITENLTVKSPKGTCRSHKTCFFCHFFRFLTHLFVLACCNKKKKDGKSPSHIYQKLGKYNTLLNQIDGDENKLMHAQKRKPPKYEIQDVYMVLSVIKEENECKH